ncbi:Phospholipid-transporting ATPase IA [Orchesella cincta]|uniref:Phospholipid-transporting ATPase n=1 Tax=Orchesella cincta TaxID=48709 RepID=A0A1D2MYD2_ORCCI|nr:Phospholipid-transporting ATPase IA [Orchesella cincta]
MNRMATGNRLTIPGQEKGRGSSVPMSRSARSLATSSSISFDPQGRYSRIGPLIIPSTHPHPKPRARLILVNSPIQPEVFIGNDVNTGKYSFWSFIPSFLFEQFRRYSNIFFLVIALLQQIPDVSPTGKFTTLIPLIFILTVSAIKEIVEDVKRHKADKEINNRTVQILKNGQWKWVKWINVGVGDFVKVTNGTFFPADIALLSSSENMGLCYVETANLDGETNLKVRQGIPETIELVDTEDLKHLSGSLECELPNRHLRPYMALGPDQTLLRGAKLENTGWIIGIVIYTGSETKLMMNSTKVPLKRSTVDKLTNKQIVMLFILLICVSLLCSVMNLLVSDEKMWYIPEYRELGSVTVWKRIVTFVYSFMTFMILFNNLIPISLTVTLEVVRFVQAQFINWDMDMYHAETNTFATARTSNLNEELGQVRYIFSDKTGTLTRNVMEFKGCSVHGEIYNPEDLFHGQNELVTNLEKEDESAKDICQFLTLLAVCHSIIPEYPENGGDTIYHASSPDEVALVSGARHLGYVFEKRTPLWVEIKALDKLERFELLTTLEFTSTRKRMSVIVRAPDGKIRLYVKGADSMILQRLKVDTDPTMEKIKQKTNAHLEEFSTQGLRTLCCAMAEIPEKAYEDVWVLTGDKQETAINIGHSCRLLSPTMELLIINRDTVDTTLECIYNYVNQLSAIHGTLPKEYDAAVIVDGATLKFALHDDIKDEFLQLCCSCKAVIVSALASDYAIAQFRFLKKLLFVHGAWSYDRMTKLIFYSYYKNICLYIIELWFAIYSGWSGQIVFERWTIGFYNMFFTAAQPIAMGICDRDCSQEMRLKYPILYKQNQDAFNLKSFFIWIGNSLLHSVCLFWFTFWLYGSGVIWSDGKEGGYLVMGNFIYTYVVIVVSLKSGLETKSWTLFNHIAIWGSILLWFLFLTLYSYAYIYLPIGQEMLGIAGLVFSAPVFWVGLLVVPMATLAPDIIVKSIESTEFQTLADKLRQCEAEKVHPKTMFQKESPNKGAAERSGCAQHTIESTRSRVYRWFGGN